jgi:hypothetical protein
MTPDTPMIASATAAPYRAVSNRDYRGQKLPSILGPETKEGWSEVTHAREWLRSIKHGGRIERWNAHERKYEVIETVEATK